MKDHDMLAYVSCVSGTDRDRSKKMPRAFLETLGTRLPSPDTKDLAAQLPQS